MWSTDWPCKQQKTHQYKSINSMGWNISTFLEFISLNSVHSSLTSYRAQVTYTMALKLYKCPKRQNCHKRVELISMRYSLLAFYCTYNYISLLVCSQLITKNLKMRNFAQNFFKQNINSIHQQENELGHSDAITREVTKQSWLLIDYHNHYTRHEQWSIW